MESCPQDMRILVNALLSNRVAEVNNRYDLAKRKEK